MPGETALGCKDHVVEGKVFDYFGVCQYSVSQSGILVPMWILSAGHIKGKILIGKLHRGKKIVWQSGKYIYLIVLWLSFFRISVWYYFSDVDSKWRSQH